MELPRSNPVGLLEVPASYRRTPRNHSRGTRFVAALLAVAFAAVVVSTGAASLARYCLTSHAGAPFPFREFLTLGG